MHRHTWPLSDLLGERKLGLLKAYEAVDFAGEFISPCVQTLKKTCLCLRNVHIRVVLLYYMRSMGLATSG